MRRSLKSVLLSMFGKASAIVAAFSVFHGATASAQGELCDNPNQYCTPMIQTVCVEKLYGAGAVAVQASTTDCRSQRRSYMACIASAAQLCSPPAKEERRSEKVHSSGCSSEDARELWSELRTSKFIDDLEGFAKICKGTPQAMLAGNRAKRLRKQAEDQAKAARGRGEAKGWKVVEAQAHLVRLGLFSGQPNGVWNGAGRAALKAFQQSAGLPATGELTMATLEALRAKPAASKKRPPVVHDGVWEGQYRYDDTRPPVAFRLTLRQRGAELTGRSDEPQTFGRRDTGMLHADWVGRVSPEGLLAFVKTYDGTGGQTHSIRYTGRLVAPGRIEGRWSINPRVNGSFTLIRQ